jgi:hypothetical protein
MEKIIYAVAALTIDTPTRKGIVQVPGRMSAQFGHAVSRMRMHRMAAFATSAAASGYRRVFQSQLLKMADEAITTIHLECRDSKELAHVANLLRQRRVKFYEFEDRNPGVYGPGQFTTALATFPVFKRQVEGILDYLPLFAKDLVRDAR